MMAQLCTSPAVIHPPVEATGHKGTGVGECRRRENERKGRFPTPDAGGHRCNIKGLVVPTSVKRFNPDLGTGPSGLPEEPGNESGWTVALTHWPGLFRRCMSFLHILISRPYFYLLA